MLPRARRTWRYQYRHVRLVICGSRLEPAPPSFPVIWDVVRSGFGRQARVVLRLDVYLVTTDAYDCLKAYTRKHVGGPRHPNPIDTLNQRRFVTGL